MASCLASRNFPGPIMPPSNQLLQEAFVEIQENSSPRAHASAPFSILTTLTPSQPTRFFFIFVIHSTNIRRAPFPSLQDAGHTFSFRQLSAALKEKAGLSSFTYWVYDLGVAACLFRIPEIVVLPHRVVVRITGRKVCNTLRTVPGISSLRAPCVPGTRLGRGQECCLASSLRELAGRRGKGPLEQTLRGLGLKA